jgi:hypothetical protein
MSIEPQSFETFLKEAIFRPVAARVIDRGQDSLSNVARFLNSGIEGWLKVETARALGSLIGGFQNSGPDLRLTNGLFIELKGATNCNSSYILTGLKYFPTHPQLACLFLGGGTDRRIDAFLGRLSLRSKMIEHARFLAGSDEWIVGLIVRPDQPIASVTLKL